MSRRPFKLTAPVAPEQDVHEAIRRLLDVALPRGAVHFAVDHSSKASAVVGARLKARGGIRGIPDHWIGWAGRTLWLEIKTAIGRASPEQLALHARLAANGCPAFIVRSPEEALAALVAAKIPVQARISA